jgi:hypothetical protein
MDFHMRSTKTDAFARAMADKIIAERFGKDYGTFTLADYLALIDRRTTAHLSNATARRIIGIAGKQRRDAVLRIENTSTLTIAIPMRDGRNGPRIWAVTEFGLWLDVIESGADGVWFFNRKDATRFDGQVCVKLALQKTARGPQRTPVARIIVNAKEGQQARRRDNDPLNLRRDNLFLLGNPGTAEGRVGNAKTDPREQARVQADARAALRGRNYGMPDDAV